MSLLEKPLGSGATITVRRGQFRSKITPAMQTLVRAQVRAIPDQAFISAISDSVVRVKKVATQAASEFDAYVDFAQGVVAEEVLKTVIRPIIVNIETALHHASLSSEDLVYEIEDDLREHVVAAIQENLAATLTSLALQQDLKPLAQLLNEHLGPNALRPYLEEFFTHLATADVYEELLSVAQVLAANESLDLYLYILDLLWKGHQFPVAYISAKLAKQGDEFHIRLDSRLFFNRRALRYIPEHDESRKLRIPAAPTDDRIHVVFDKAPRDILEDAVIALGDAYSIADRLAIDSGELRKVTAGDITLTNAFHFCAFDKSEESIINDYEEILLDTEWPNGVLSELFDALIHGCILSEPINCRRQIDAEWSGTPGPERILYDSPVPLNEEQRKLLLALRRPESRYNIVDGPPGTGKSHTITAIAFDAIQRSQSVLVLSDKNEALDVVEDKLTQVLNEIRVGDDFPNPLLRLGRDTGTYGEILSRASVERIARHHAAASSVRTEVQNKIGARRSTLKSQMGAMTQVLSSVSMQELMECERLGAAFPTLDALPVERLAAAAEILQQGVIAFWDSFDTNQRMELVRACGNCSQLKEMSTRIAQMVVCAEVSTKHRELTRLLGQFQGVTASGITFLETALGELHALRRPIIGFLFRKRELEEIDRQFRSRLPLEGVRRPHQRLRDLQQALTALKTLRELTLSIGLDEDTIAASVTGLKAGGGHTSLSRACVQNVRSIAAFARAEPEIYEAAGLLNNPVTVLRNWTQADTEPLRRLVRYLQLRVNVGAKLEAVPTLDLQQSQAELQQLHAAQLAHTLDDRFLKFAYDKQAIASTFKDIIKRKKPFPREKFDSLKDAFPCIIAGIREFADYIPLAPELFDLVIIDEASQVSIAQAFPALLRARQIVVMGDEKQFANVKTSQASRAVNSTYIGALEQTFRKNFNADEEQLSRMRQFYVRTSILKFFELIANFRIMLRKHFRGYQEIISFSSRFFYGDELQAIRIRAQPIDDVICFSMVELATEAPRLRNANASEAEFIHTQLQELLDRPEPPTVGIITPFTEQQKALNRRLLFESEFATDFRDRLRLKIMTFDTCQGEERDVIYYSMVASAGSDKLAYIFPPDLHNLPDDADQKIKVQRLNVGFSRAKDCVHFVTSQPIESFRGSIGQALRHYQQARLEARRDPNASDVDPASPMEAKVLHWLKQTAFMRKYGGHVEIHAQFPIGRYLRQLDPGYKHPAYRCDFLVVVSGERGKAVAIILEYDGFREHFTSRENVTDQNYEFYYRPEDVERQQVLESYGYNFIRINRFNLGRDPVATLSARLEQIVAARTKPFALNETSRATNAAVEALAAGLKKQCPKCSKILVIKEFQRPDLKTGRGRVCNACAQ